MSSPANMDTHSHTHTKSLTLKKGGKEGGGTAVVLNPRIWAKSQRTFLSRCHKTALSPNNTLRSTPFD